MADTGTPPVIPADLQQYNSYVTDPEWQRKFTLIWGCFLAAAVVLSLPSLLTAIKQKRAFPGLFGIRETWGQKEDAPYDSMADIPTPRRRNATVRKIEGVLSTVSSVWLWSLPGLGLNLGHVVLILLYSVVVLICITKGAELVDNPNRAGFLAIAQLPVVFLFATKNSIVSLMLGPGHGYERLNYIHRWSGRLLFLGATVHGSLWIRNHLEWDLPILGQQKETSGVACLGLLCVIVLTSLRPVRRYAYQVFFAVHVLAFVAFFITLCYHTIYASPWIFPPLAFYGLDMLMRLFKYRIKDATLEAVGNQMTLIRVPFCDAGWIAGQHVKMRVFFSGRVLESHPLTILNATPETSCLSNSASVASGGGVIFGARVKGDWTRALNSFALRAADERAKNLDIKCETPEVPILVMMEGPYGGCSIDLGKYENVLLFAGGSGATFTIGMLDDIVGRCVRRRRRLGEVTRKIEFAWCVKSFGSMEWFTPMLMEIAQTAAEPNSGLDLHFTVFVTCLCNPEAVPAIPNLDVLLIKPSATDLLRALVAPQDFASSPSLDGERKAASVDVEKEGGSQEGAAVSVEPVLHMNKTPLRDVASGGVGVCAAGPESLTRETANAVARLSMKRGIELGGVGLHTEVYAI